MNNSKSLIGTSFLITALTISAAELQKRDSLPPPEAWIGFAFAFMVMGAANDLGADAIGSGLALLLMVSTLAVRGDDALKFLGSWQRGRRGRNMKQTRTPKGLNDGSSNVRGPRRADPARPVIA